MKNLRQILRRTSYTLLLCIPFLIVSAQDFSFISKECTIEKQGGKYGLVFRGTQLTDFKYDDIKQENKYNYRVEQNHKLGVISFAFVEDRKGMKKQETYVPVEIKNKTYCVYVYETLPCVYESITPYESSNLLLVREGKKGLVNQYYTTIVPCKYDNIEDKYGFYYVTSGDKHGLINQYGTTIIPCVYERIQQEGDKYVVGTGGKNGIINQYGTTIIPCVYERIQQEGDKYIVGTGNKNGIINLYGTTILPCKFKQIKKVKNQYIVTYNDLYGVYNMYGTAILPCKYESIEILSNGQFRTKEGEHVKLYNAYGSFIADVSDHKVTFSTQAMK